MPSLPLLRSPFNQKTMKKLLLLVLLAAPCALFAQQDQYKFPTARIADNEFFTLGHGDPNSLPVGLLLDAFINPAEIDFTNDDGTVSGANSVGSIGFGVEIDAGHVKISGIGFGISWSYSIKNDSGIPYLSLSVGINSFGIPYSFENMRLGFDTPGINIDAFTAWDMVTNGYINIKVFQAMENGSSDAWRTQLSAAIYAAIYRLYGTGDTFADSLNNIVGVGTKPDGSSYAIQFSPDASIAFEDSMSGGYVTVGNFTAGSANDPYYNGLGGDGGGGGGDDGGDSDH